MLRWSVFLVPVLIIFYLVYIFRTPSWTGGERIGWATAIVLVCPPLVNARVLLPPRLARHEAARQ